jgi:hypothetical protein
MVPPPKEGTVERVVGADDLKFGIGNSTVRKRKPGFAALLIDRSLGFLAEMPGSRMGGRLHP